MIYLLLTRDDYTIAFSSVRRNKNPFYRKAMNNKMYGIINEATLKKNILKANKSRDIQFEKTVALEASRFKVKDYLNMHC